MGFLDKAKAAATDLAAKADTALAGAGLGGGTGAHHDADSYLRDLGVIAFLQATGRPVEAADHQRVFAALQAMEANGQLRSLALRTTAAPVPGEPGGMGFTPPPPGSATTPPPAPAPAAAEQPVAPPPPSPAAPPPAPSPAAPPAPSPVPPPPAPSPAAAPPPPPSWA